MLGISPSQIEKSKLIFYCKSVPSLLYCLMLQNFVHVWNLYLKCTCFSSHVSFPDGWGKWWHVLMTKFVIDYHCKNANFTGKIEMILKAKIGVHVASVLCIIAPKYRSVLCLTMKLWYFSGKIDWMSILCTFWSYWWKIHGDIWWSKYTLRYSMLFNR